MTRAFVIDRIEGNVAVCQYETGESFNLALSLLPKGVKEQDWVKQVLGSYTIDSQLTAEKQKYNKDLYSSLRKKDK